MKDKKKVGGSYQKKKGQIKRIDTYQKQMIFQDNTKINIKDIIKIDIFR